MSLSIVRCVVWNHTFVQQESDLKCSYEQYGQKLSNSWKKSCILYLNEPSKESGCASGWWYRQGIIYRITLPNFSLSIPHKITNYDNFLNVFHGIQHLQYHIKSSWITWSLVSNALTLNKNFDNTYFKHQSHKAMCPLCTQKTEGCKNMYKVGGT